MQIASFHELVLHHLRDIYSAEQQALKAYPKVAKSIENDKLLKAVEKHRQETEKQVQRLEKIFDRLGEKPGGIHCKGMEGLIEETLEMIEESQDQEVMEAGLIVALQKMEHYEIAAYGSAVTFAKLMDEDKTTRGLVKELERTLGEEKKTDEKLSQLAERSINLEAADEEEEMEEVEV
jgi:ferritin-like metal-binding protein YciE